MQSGSGSRCATRAWAVIEIAITVLLSISIAVLAVAGTFQVLLLPQVTTALSPEFARDDISYASHDELVSAAEQTLAYCVGNPDAQLPVGDDWKTAYTPDVVSHLDDVKAFFSGMRVAAVVPAIAVCVLAAVTFLLSSRLRARKVACRSLAGGGFAVLVVAATIAVAALIDFNTVFNFLHSLFFPSGTWTFPMRSLLICALPEEYWIAMGVIWAVLAIAAVAGLLVSAFIVRRRGRAQVSA